MASRPEQYSRSSTGMPELGRVGNAASPHSSEEQLVRIFLLGAVAALLASIYPSLVKSAYGGSAQFHAGFETVGALIGLIAGTALILRFYALGNRFHLFIGLAFFVNAAEDFAHGLLCFESLHQWVGLAESSLSQFGAGTYATGRLLMALILLAAPFAPRFLGHSRNPKHEAIWCTGLVLVVSFSVTLLVARVPFPRIIFPDHLISRPADLLSTFLFVLGTAFFVREYRRRPDTLTWWVLLSLIVNLVGQFMMSFSKVMYDPFFDIASVYKLMGYAAPLVGLCIYQIAVIAELQRAKGSLQERTEQLSRSNEELKGALAQVRTLQGLLPFCSKCKKIRDDNGYWQQVEVYVRDHTDVRFSHGLCPECLGKEMAELHNNK